MRLLLPVIIIGALLGAVLWLDDAPPDADLVYVNQNEVFTLDPQRMSYLQDFRLGYALYEGLARWRTDTFELAPAAAHLPNVAADGLTYTFTLQADARWANGDPVTAHDFIYAWSRAITPDTAADYSNLFFVIDGAEAFFRWRLEQTAAYAARHTTTPADAEALWHDTEVRFRETVGLRAVDDRTLEVRLRSPTAYFLDLVAFAPFLPVHRPTVEGWPDINHASGWHHDAPPPWPDRRFVRLDPRTGKLRQRHGWTMPDRHLGNGPYELDAWRYKRDLHLVRNPHYRAADQIRCATILIQTIEDTNTAVLAFESGRVDWLLDVGTSYEADMVAQRLTYVERHEQELRRLRSAGHSEDEALAQLPAPRRDERRNIHVRPSFGTDFYSFNCRPTLADGRPNPFADARVRRAFTMAVDKTVIVRHVTRLNEPVATTLIPRGSIPGYASPNGLPFDVQRARRELADAGWIDRDRDGIIDDADGTPFPTIDLLYTTSTPRYKWISLNLADQWQNALGVRIELRATETKFYKEDLKQGQFMIARGRWYGDYGDPTTFLDLCRSTDGNNDRGYANPDIDDLLDQASQQNDPARRMRLLEQCERILMNEEVPMIPICQLVELYMYEPGRLSGLTTHPRLVQYLGDIAVPHEP